MRVKSLTYKLFLLYWPIVMFNYFLLMSTKINLTILLVDLPLVFFVLRAISICLQKSKNKFVTIFGLFALYILLTGLAYGFNKTPYQCYLLGIQYYFAPLCFAPLGYSLATNHGFNKFYLYACLFCFLIGFYLYATLPPMYMDYLAEVQGYEKFNQDQLFGVSRFSSFLPGPYNISYLSVPALILSIAYSVNPDAGINRLLCYLIAGVSFIAAIICQQRISMFFAIIIVSFYAFYLSQKGNRSIILAFIGIIVLLMVIINNYVSEMPFFDTLKENVLMRIEKMDVSDAMSERTGQYTGFDRATWWSYIIGLGLGSCGHLALPYNLHTISDGEFVKTFFEFGLLGTVLFVFLIVKTLLRGVRLFKYLHAEVLIVFFFLGACIGASALTFFVYNSMFWFSMGRIWNNDYIALRKQEMMKVLTI